MAATKATIPALQLITSGAHPAKPIISLNVSGLFSEYVCPLFIVGDSARCMAESMSTMSDDDDDVVVESNSSIDAVFFTIIEDERTDFLVDFCDDRREAEDAVEAN
jgi:hypothetical protein